METQLRIIRFQCSVTATVPEGVVEANVGYLPWVLGENLAGQVDAWVMEERFGYYPALEFFRGRQQVVDPALLLLIDEVVRYCTLYLKRESRRRLSRAFSAVDVLQARSTAYGLPHVRPSRGGAPSELAQHYAPNRIKADLVLSSIQKGDFDQAESLARRQLNAWLGNSFSHLEVGGLRRARD